MTSVLAVDIALLPPTDLRRQLIALNSPLAGPPVGFRFDERHHPHLSLAQQFIQRADLDRLTDEVGHVLDDHSPLELVTADVSNGRTSATLRVDATPALYELHRRLMDVLLLFDAVDGDVDAFDTEGDRARDADLLWVRTFREKSAYGAFDPHWTLGVGTVETPVQPTVFLATEVCLFQLGRFCTCRRPLASWTLTAPDR